MEIKLLHKITLLHINYFRKEEKIMGSYIKEPMDIQLICS